MLVELLQSSLQRLRNGTGESDASCAVSTAPSSSAASSRGRRKRKRRHQDDSDDDKESLTLLPLVHSIQELSTACQRQLLWSDRNDERSHEQRMKEQSQLTAVRKQYSKRMFRPQSKLTDEARSYRKQNAELDPNNEQTLRLSAFYVNECRQIEDKIRRLELKTFNNNS